MAALKAERRRGTTAICRSRPWKHKLGICRASTCNYEASAPTISAKGGRRQCGHGDGASRRNTGEPVSGAAALPSATSEQRRRGDVVGSWRSYGRDGGGARCAPAGNGNGGTVAAAALLAAGERGGEEEGRRPNASVGSERVSGGGGEGGRRVRLHGLPARGAVRASRARGGHAAATA